MEQPRIALDSPPSRARFKPSSHLPWILLILLVVALAGFVQLGYLTWSGRDDSPQEKARRLQLLAERNADFGRYLDEARAKTQWKNTAEFVKDMRETFVEYQQKAQALNDQLSSLETDRHPVASQIAGDPQLLRQYVALKERKRPTAEEWEHARASLRELEEVCRNVLSDRSVIVDRDEKFQSTFSQVAEPLLGNCEQLKVDLSSLDTLIQQAAGKPPGKQSFQAALASYIQQRDIEFLKSLADDTDLQRRELLRRARDKEFISEQAMLKAENRLRSEAADAKTARAEAILKEAQTKLAAVKETPKRTEPEKRKRN